ncbi:MAG: hypothetical protein O7G83_17850, partial [Proteobacteria bacterium]|nr:hypothetical protein [Pseudomonadota bacterium]
MKAFTRRTEPDDYLFCAPDGEQVKGFSELFGYCLDDAEMRYQHDDPNKGRSRVGDLKHRGLAMAPEPRQDTGQRWDIAAPKVEALRRTVQSVTYFPDEIECSLHKNDVRSYSVEQFWETFEDCPVILDTTADERVRRHLSQFELAEGVRLCRVEIYDRGRLSVSRAPCTNTSTENSIWASLISV